jgi:hypothetical protein
MSFVFNMYGDASPTSPTGPTGPTGGTLYSYPPLA